MVCVGCPMFSGYGASGFYLNWILVAIIFSLIFWGVYYLMEKNKENNKRRGKKK